MAAYYNEHDPKAAAWLRELIKQGHIADGIVDERSIEDVIPDELHKFTQCHFFAGIGVWSYALRQAGWPDDRPVWTGSCPCQPFSAAGKGTGFADERHLWPAWHHLISQCCPPTIFGEQVASKDGLSWLDLVQSDLEAAGYAVGAFDLCAAGVGAPHIRQRLFFVADADNAGSQGHGRPVGIDDTQGWDGQGRYSPKSGVAVELADAYGWNASAEREQSGWEQRQQQEDSGIGRMADANNAERRPDGAGGNEPQRADTGRAQDASHAERGSAVCKLADAAIIGRVGRRASETGNEPGEVKRLDGLCDVGGMDHATDARRQAAGKHDGGSSLQSTRSKQPSPDGYRPRPTNGFWGVADWLYCTDGRWRPVEPGTSPLAHGSPARVGRLRGYGNAIVAPLAQTFIEEAMRCIDA